MYMKITMVYKLEAYCRHHLQSHWLNYVAAIRWIRNILFSVTGYPCTFFHMVVLMPVLSLFRNFLTGPVTNFGPYFFSSTAMILSWPFTF